MDTADFTNWCGTMPVHRRLLDAYPSYGLARAAIEDYTFDQLAADIAPRETVLTIPVVVHVVWRDPVENIADEQVHNQIAVLNKDFRATNPDVSTVPAVWRPVVGDALIEFVLASTDPSGAPCTGITRTGTDAVAFDTDDRVKSAATGGVDAWPADRYLNVWVCQLGGGLLGYAQFPGGPAETDGVVILHSAFGTGGTARAPFDGGRTAVHEIGHWLNLRHIWGDDGDGCGGSDLVDDTPNQSGPRTGAPVFPAPSCNNGPDGDMFVNYMDYTDDAIMVMFTRGQVQRMDACLSGPRRTIVTAETPVPQDRATA
jgi:hypothetical protein